MIVSALPFEYLQYIERGERVRRPAPRPKGSRVRRRTRGGAGQ